MKTLLIACLPACQLKINDFNVCLWAWLVVSEGPVCWLTTRSDVWNLTTLNPQGKITRNADTLLTSSPHIQHKRLPSAHMLKLRICQYFLVLKSPVPKIAISFVVISFSAVPHNFSLALTFNVLHLPLSVLQHQKKGTQRKDTMNNSF